MTREEAFDGIYYADTFDLAQEMVNKIYDDFESRTCENCKFYIEERTSLYHNGTRHICRNEQVGEIVYDYLSFDFGCNKFERKES